MLNLKNINSFFLNPLRRKGLYIVVICNPTQVQEENTKLKFILNILEPIHVGSETGSRNPELDPDPNHLIIYSCLLQRLQIRALGGPFHPLHGLNYSADK
jgi:hypothetical protein